MQVVDEEVQLVVRGGGQPLYLTLGEDVLRGGEVRRLSGGDIAVLRGGEAP